MTIRLTLTPKFTEVGTSNIRTLVKSKPTKPAPPVTQPEETPKSNNTATPSFELKQADW